MAIEESAPDVAVPPAAALSSAHTTTAHTMTPTSSVIGAVRGHLSLTRLQGICGTVAALLSISGASATLLADERIKRAYLGR